MHSNEYPPTVDAAISPLEIAWSDIASEVNYLEDVAGLLYKRLRVVMGDAKADTPFDTEHKEEINLLDKFKNLKSSLKDVRLRLEEINERLIV